MSFYIDTTKKLIDRVEEVLNPRQMSNGDFYALEQNANRQFELIPRIDSFSNLLVDMVDIIRRILFTKKMDRYVYKDRGTLGNDTIVLAIYLYNLSVFTDGFLDASGKIDFNMMPGRQIRQCFDVMYDIAYWYECANVYMRLVDEKDGDIINRFIDSYYKDIMDDYYMEWFKHKVSIICKS